MVSKTGFKLKATERFKMVYQNKTRRLEVQLDPGEPLAVYLSHAFRDYEVPDAEQERIARDVRAGLAFLEIDAIVE
jgi:hypothetical protein